MSLTGKRCDNPEPHTQHEWPIEGWDFWPYYWCAGTRIRELREQPTPQPAVEQEPK